MYRRITTLFVLLIISFQTILAQPSKNLTSEEVERYKEQCKDMISYLEGTFNFLGDPQQVIAEKEIIINESYLKIFRDPEVQIEDDLDPDREVPLRKDVQAYLKDIVFFFKKVTFRFEVKSVEVINTEHEEIGFKVTMNRHLKGVMVNNDTIDNNLTRYVEINLDPYKQDLRIVSIYTTIPNEKEEMRYWWQSLPDAWRNFFGNKVLVYDTLPMNYIVAYNDTTIVIKHQIDTIVKDSVLVNGVDTLSYEGNQEALNRGFSKAYVYRPQKRIYFDTVPASVSVLDFYLKSIFRLKELVIKNNKTIKTLEPVARLTNLEVLNCSNTAVTDLLPVRNLNKLKELNSSHNKVTTVRPLRFNFELTELNLGYTLVDTINALHNLTSLEKLVLDSTRVSDLTPLKDLGNLSFLSLAYTPVSDLSPIASLKSLKRLIIKGSQVKDLSPLAHLPALEYINLDETLVDDLKPLAQIPTLTVIQANGTKVKNLDGLGKEQQIKLIYCDHTGVNRITAMEFMDRNPQTLVIFDSNRLLSWWRNLSQAWKKVLINKVSVTDSVTKEVLHKIVNIKSLDLSGNQEINDLTPVKMLFRLESIDLSNTAVKNLAPLAYLDNLRYLNIENTMVSSLKSLSETKTLRKLIMDHTKVDDLLPLKNNRALKVVYADHTGVSKENVLLFKKYVPECLVIYQTEILSFWWNNMTDEWRKELVKQLGAEGDDLSREQLQELVDLKKVVIKNNIKIDDLEPLAVFHYLKELHVNNTSVVDVSPLSVLDSLKILNLSNNPVVDITPLSRLTGLEELYLENTGVDDLTPVSSLTRLKVLNIAGTKVKKLKPLSGLHHLQRLIINNTEVKKLNDLDGLKELKFIKCYNTNIKSKKVEDFKKRHPDVEIVFY